MILLDLSLRKKFRIPIWGGETGNLRFQADLFNMPNHASFRSVDTNVASNSYGSITSSSGPGRNIQFSLKLNY